MDLDITRLRYFLAVAEEQHFKRAADRLRISAPPLSKQIKQLESELGGPLFERGYHSVQLTTLGAALVEPTRDILERVDALRALSAQILQAPIPIRIGATGYAPPADLELAQVAAENTSELQNASFTISGSSAEVVAQLLSGDIELGLVHTPLDDPAVTVIEVIEVRSGIAVRADDPLAGRAFVTVDDIKDREVAIDFARPNPRLLEIIKLRLRTMGFSRLVEAGTSPRPGDSEIAAATRNRRLVTLVEYAPSSTTGRIFSGPEWALIPLQDERWIGDALGVAWATARGRTDPQLAHLGRALADAVRRRAAQPEPA